MSRALLLSIALLVGACGPSLQAVHESDLHFERCHRLDFVTKVPAMRRESCWRQWIAGYGAGQSRDRNDYARKRLQALRAGQSESLSLTEPASSMGPVSGGSLVPSSLHDAPPATRAAAAPRPAAADCVERCRRDWDECRACSDRPATHDGATSGTRRCAECEEDYEDCVERCVDEVPSHHAPDKSQAPRKSQDGDDDTDDEDDDF